jgi:hypothetical protein
MDLDSVPCCSCLRLAKCFAMFLRVTLCHCKSSPVPISFLVRVGKCYAMLLKQAPLVLSIGGRRTWRSQCAGRRSRRAARGGAFRPAPTSAASRSSCPSGSIALGEGFGRLRSPPGMNPCSRCDRPEPTTPPVSGAASCMI